MEGAGEGTRYPAPMIMLPGPETVKSGNGSCVVEVMRHAFAVN